MTNPMTPPPQPPENPEARREQSEAFSRTSSLLLSEDFAWFSAGCLDAKIKEASERALNVKTDDRERDRAVHVHAALLEVKAWVEQTHENARQFLKGS